MSRPYAVGSWPLRLFRNLQPSPRLHGQPPALHRRCAAESRAHRHGMMMASRWCGAFVLPGGVDSDAPWASRCLLPWRRTFRWRSTVAASTACPPHTGLRSVAVVSGTWLGTAGGLLGAFRACPTVQASVPPRSVPARWSTQVVAMGSPPPPPPPPPRILSAPFGP
jgi:hypothetical protein